MPYTKYLNKQHLLYIVEMLKNVLINNISDHYEIGDVMKLIGGCEIYPGV